MPPTFGAFGAFAFFGAAVRFVQLGIQLRPHVAKTELAAYPFYAAVAMGAGWYLQGVEDRQNADLARRKELLLEKRRRRDEIERTLAES